ncbi:hypothetical protein B0T19DRAFT_426660 [Cercophora scortea]|uniref:Uncharacterized protein n=1 Tax=Cercophora scortea TaxID=314031 RepID=A0AAE0IEX7_9PEZI|nr:hypothetical protein B0T19DRAFT_426660 [Cercophora scortea]
MAGRGGAFAQGYLSSFGFLVLPGSVACAGSVRWREGRHRAKGQVTLRCLFLLSLASSASLSLSSARCFIFGTMSYSDAHPYIHPTHTQPLHAYTPTYGI